MAVLPSHSGPRQGFSIVAFIGLLAAQCHNSPRDSSSVPAAPNAKPGAQACAARKLSVEVNGDGGLLHLSRRELASVGVLTTGQQTCTVVAVGARVVLTAAHCVNHPVAELCVSMTDGLSLTTTSVESITRWPGTDVAALRLVGEVDPMTSHIIPAEAPLASNGALLQVVGFGFDRRVNKHHRRSMAVVAVPSTDSEIVGQTRGRGPCNGDSGAPLLGRDSQGALRLYGLLAKGSPDCIGNDTYSRIDRRIMERIEVDSGPLVGLTATRDRVVECEPGEQEAFCMGSRRFLCDPAGRWRVYECQSPSVCGWLPGVGPSCVPLRSDPCAGTGSVGRCEENKLLVCNLGRPRHIDCGAMGQECGLHGEQGQYSCLDPVWAECDARLIAAAPGAPCRGSWDCDLSDHSNEVLVWCDHGQLQIERTRRRHASPDPLSRSPSSTADRGATSHAYGASTTPRHTGGDIFARSGEPAAM